MSDLFDQGLFLLNTLLELDRETEWIEFKKSNRDPSEIGQNISALSNSSFLHDQRRGYLVYGIDDVTHDIVGTEFYPRKETIGNEELENWLARLLDPRIDFEIQEYETDGKHVVIFVIDPARDRPIKFRGTAYIRIGTYTKKLADYPEKERKIWIKGERVSFEELTSLDNLYAEDAITCLDWDKYFRMLSRNAPDNSESILEQLADDELVVSEGSRYHITNLGAILFARDITRFPKLARKTVRVITYKGKNRTKTTREQEGRYGYAVGFEGIIDFINDKLPAREEIGRALREEIRVYPDIAIREVVANALIHQDFDIRGTGPMIEIFEDRIEVTNPGKPLVEPIRFIDHIPRSRNEKLAALMRRLKICEERGGGIDKVINAVELYQLPPPLFEEESEFVRVTLFGPRSLAKMNKREKIRACFQHCVLKYVSGEFMSNQSLRGRLQIDKKNYSTASRIISEAVSVGLLKEKDPSSSSKKLTQYVPFWA